MSFEFAFIGCLDNQVAPFEGIAEARKGGQAFSGSWLMGDTPYIRMNDNWWTLTDPTPMLNANRAADQAAIQTHYLQMFANPGITRLPVLSDTRFHIYDDHEMMGNNWDHTVAAANSGGQSNLQVTDISDVCFHWWEMLKAYDQNLIDQGYDNPYPNTDDPDSGAGGEYPPQALAGPWPAGVTGDILTDFPVTNYPARFWSTGWDINGVPTHNPVAPYTNIVCMTYTLDTIGRKSDHLIVSTEPTKVFLGPNQELWLKDKMKDANDNGVQLHLIVAGKNLYEYGAADGYASCLVERQRVLDWIESEGIRGCAWVGGDDHRAHFSREPAGANTQQPMNMCVTPSGRELTDYFGPKGIGAGDNSKPDYLWTWPYAEVVYNDGGPEFRAIGFPSYGRVDVLSATRMELSLRHPSSDVLVKAFQINAGSNIPVSL